VHASKASSVIGALHTVAARHRGLTLLVLCNDKTVCDDIRKVVATRLHKDKECVGDDAQ
jgi:hypothetical protein